MSSTSPSQASGGILITVELMINWDRGNPSTIKQRRQSVVPRLESKALNRVAPKKAQTLVNPKDSSAAKQAQARLHASSAGSGHTKSLMNIERYGLVGL